jgi:hypothetical protein
VVKIKTFVIGFIIAYLLISLPAMLGIGFVIDWVPEATFLQKFKGYVVDGLIDNYLLKIIISAILGIVFTIIVLKRK